MLKKHCSEACFPVNYQAQKTEIRLSPRINCVPDGVITGIQDPRHCDPPVLLSFIQTIPFPTAFFLTNGNANYFRQYD